LLPRAPGIRRLRASEIQIIGNERIPTQADGDIAGFSPVTVTDAPGPIQVVVG
jgi:diacylglycerol kinase (ATP)